MSAIASDRITTLRQELKQWENSFAAANGGKKAGREEIKKDAAIAAKYKEYNHLRAAFSKSTSTAPPAHHPTTQAAAPAGPASPSKRSRANDCLHSTAIISSPRKRRHLTTPRKQKHHAHDSGVEFPTSEDHPDNDDLEAITPIAKRLFVGPTPQKNGRVLGLFDLLSSAEKEKGSTSPSKRRQLAAQDSPSKPRPVLSNVTGNANSTSISTTPHKRSQAFDAADLENTTIPLPNFASPTKNSRTPQSASKRYLLDTFITPSKRRRLSDSSPSKFLAAGAHNPSLEFGTPAFLRRDSQRFAFGLEDVMEEEDADEDEAAGDDDGFDAAALQSPSKTRAQRPQGLRNMFSSKMGISQPRALRRSTSRTLSSMIAEMRQAEDDRFDDEMDVLREMEGGGNDDAHDLFRSRDRRPPPGDRAMGNVLIEDSQLAFPDVDIEEGALGPDGHDGLQESDAAGQESTAQGPPRRLWKKKGAKRQTRKVILRPVRRKAGAGAVHEGGNGDGEDELDSQPDGQLEVAETQVQHVHDGAGSEDDEDDYADSASESDFEDEDDAGVTAKEEKKPRKANSSPAKTASSTATAQAKAAPETTSTVKKAKKKISATANANFCRLKIRSSKGAAGGKPNAFKSRFGRRR